MLLADYRLYAFLLAETVEVGAETETEVVDVAVIETVAECVVAAETIPSVGRKVVIVL